MNWVPRDEQMVEAVPEDRTAEWWHETLLGVLCLILATGFVVIAWRVIGQ